MASAELQVRSNSAANRGRGQNETLKGAGNWKNTSCAIQSRITTHDQRGTNRPSGNVKRKAARAENWMKVSKMSSRTTTGAAYNAWKALLRVVEIPAAPNMISRSETNRPIQVSDFRQKMSRPTPQKINETRMSMVRNTAAQSKSETPRCASAW